MILTEAGEQRLVETGDEARVDERGLDAKPFFQLCGHLTAEAEECA